MAVPMSGSTSEASLPEILQELNARRATGTLTVKAGAVEKSVHLQGGQIVFATSTDEQDRLGEVLIRAGRLRREDLESALDRLKKSGGFKKLGATLVEQGLVSPKDLFIGLKAQVKEIIYSLFLLTDAVYRFEETLPKDIIHLQFSMEEIIMEIIQRIKQEA